MSNLLAIEQSFLNLPQVRDAINLTEFNRVRRNVSNAQKKKFEHSIRLSAIVNQAVIWFDSEEGKEVFREEGIEWSKPEFGLKVFGWQKSHFYKMIKVANLDERIVEAFKRKMDEIGAEANRSIAELLKFSRTIDLSSIDVSEDASEEEIAQAEAEVIAQAEEELVQEREERVECMFSFSFKNPNGRGVSIRVNADGEVITSANPQEIGEALSTFLSAIGQRQA